MDDTLCPRCRSPLFHDAEETPGGYVAVHPVCSACNWEPLTLYSEYPMGGAESAKAEALATLDADVSPLAWFEPRDRLPTPEERRALEAKHGTEAAFCVRVIQPGRRTITVESRHAEAMYGPGLKDATSFLCWAEVEGRPVGWPEVKHG